MPSLTCREKKGSSGQQYKTMYENWTEAREKREKEKEQRRMEEDRKRELEEKETEDFMEDLLTLPK
jgi:hypothetical protein